MDPSLANEAKVDGANGEGGIIFKSRTQSAWAELIVFSNSPVDVQSLIPRSREPEITNLLCCTIEVTCKLTFTLFETFERVFYRVEVWRLKSESGRDLNGWEKERMAETANRVVTTANHNLDVLLRH